MHICILANEYFGLGTYGGFAAITRSFAEAIARNGDRVTVLLIRRTKTDRDQELNRVSIKFFSRSQIFQKDIYASIDADIYHSFEPTLATAVAMYVMPNKSHVCSFLNPYSFQDWIRSLVHNDQGIFRRVYNLCIRWIFFASPPVQWAVRKCDARCCHAKFLQKKATEIFSLKEEPIYVPTFVSTKNKSSKKAKDPCVCFVGRFDAIKRPELFFQLADAFPDVEFYAVGSAKSKKKDAALREKYAKKNIHFCGFIDQFNSDELDTIFEKSWILVNTSAKEGLPGTYLEASLFGCALLSCNEADDFVERGGMYVQDDNFKKGLSQLLQNDRWKELGNRNKQYVEKYHTASHALSALHAVYSSALQSKH